MEKDSLYLDTSTSIPVIRSSSPPPTISPTPAISSCASPDRRSFSAASSICSFSSHSSASRSSTGSAGRRQGYIRTTGSEFAESAKNRESVQSLGSIAHLQYYFARTGLLDGKGAQLARTKDGKKLNRSLTIPMMSESASSNNLAIPDASMTESPIDQDEDVWDENEPVMLPPTVSTYSHRTYQVPPPPDMKTLRRDLRQAIDATYQMLDSTQRDEAAMLERRASVTAEEDQSNSTSEQSLWELQGMNVLDVVTLAIRAARIYYTCHVKPERLAVIKSERVVREELLTVLDTLKRLASRNFAGGLKATERTTIEEWVSGVDEMLQEEIRQERLEVEKRRSWTWMNPDWDGSEYAREWSFLESFRMSQEPLPQWTPAEEAKSSPTPFLSALQNGLYLIRLHNAMIKLSKRPFGDIKKYHSDTGKPYRCAENLRFWIKAAEIRWEIKLDVDVMGVVHGTDDIAWKKFDKALLLWCQCVRTELTEDLMIQRRGSII
ncbi:MAG: hypothetical protein M1834_003699 [Cirrosporium novae-zelandiae]|nr:MAG: hypothetical protein M1834_003699 [Cirrosporium novae-zelandiae]